MKASLTLWLGVDFRGALISLQTRLACSHVYLTEVLPPYHLTILLIFILMNGFTTNHANIFLSRWWPMFLHLSKKWNLSKPTIMKYKIHWRRARITWHCFFFSLVLVLVVLTLRCLLDTQVMFFASQSSWKKLLLSVISKISAVSVFFFVNLL